MAGGSLAETPQPAPARRRQLRVGVGRVGRARLLDDVVRPGEYGRRDRQPERLSWLEIVHRLALRWLLDWQVSGPSSSKTLVHEDCRASQLTGVLGAVCHQPAHLHIFSGPENGGQAMLE